MAIDDPIDAALERVAAEERAGSPLSRFVPSLAKLAEAVPDLPGVGLLKSALAAADAVISSIEADRREYLIASLIDELRSIRANMARLDDACRKFYEDEFIPLVLDGLQKAEQTRSRERIHRIAAILAHAFELGPIGKADVT
jgi:hypothetical protein